MAKHVKHSVLPIYLVGFFWLGYALLFSLRSACFTVDTGEEGVTFRVTGFGHGVGMSQYGAELLARQGKTWQEIIHWYYADVTIGAYKE